MGAMGGAMAAKKEIGGMLGGVLDGVPILIRGFMRVLRRSSGGRLQWPP